MRYFKMTRTVDPLYGAQDLKDVVHRALDKEVHPAFFEWGEVQADELINEHYPDPEPETEEEEEAESD